MKFWRLEVEDWDILSEASRTEVTEVNRTGRRNKPITIRVVTGYNASGKIAWVTEAVMPEKVLRGGMIPEDHPDSAFYG